jgi:DNA-binding PadR family transcriptional regulator
MIDNSFTLPRLFILGLLVPRPRYGYEIVSTADLWGVHRWGGFSIGSIYHSLGRLAKEGHVQQTRAERSGKRPERQIWEITESGRRLAISYICQGLASLNYEGREVDMALAFAHLISAGQRVAQLQQRLGPLQERLNQLQYFADGYRLCDEIDDDLHKEFRRLKHEHPWIRAGVEHGLERLVIEKSWTTRLINEVATWPTDPSVVEANR